MKHLLIFAALSTLFAASPPASLSGQTVSSVITRPQKTRAELAITYSGLHLNAPVGGCGCFWANGGSAEVVLPFARSLSAVAEFSGEHAAQIPGYNGIGFSLLSGLGGLRVSHPLHTRFTPFAQGLVGGAHAFNSYFPASPAATSSATSFALTAGGGLNIALTRRLALRPIQADYHYMQLPNNSTNQQHNFRLSAGMVFRFTK